MSIRLSLPTRCCAAVRRRFGVSHVYCDNNHFISGNNKPDVTETSWNLCKRKYAVNTFANFFNVNPHLTWFSIKCKEYYYLLGPIQSDRYVHTFLRNLLLPYARNNTLVPIYQSTQRYIPEDSYLHIHRCENPQPHTYKSSSIFVHHTLPL